ncbi:MAG: hypothetical protein AB7U49_02390 [Hyphomicrobiaceae bacterium]
MPTSGLDDTQIGRPQFGRGVGCRAVAVSGADAERIIAGPEGLRLVLPLVACPEVPAGTRYELRRPSGGRPIRTSYCGTLTSTAPSLNLAKLRFRGAWMGASDVVLVLPPGSVIPEQVEL